jgi:mRNA interferase RelE/StbE
MPDQVVWMIIIHRRTERILSRLPKDVLGCVRSSIIKLGSGPRPEACNKLVGYDNLYGMRIGDWRISYLIEEVQLIILVLETALCVGAYRNLWWWQKSRSV